MTDPRLNSIHLETDRREEFRKARGAVLGSMADLTLRGVTDLAGVDSARTLIHDVADRMPHLAAGTLDEADFAAWLRERRRETSPRLP